MSATHFYWPIKHKSKIFNGEYHSLGIVAVRWRFLKKNFTDCPLPSESIEQSTRLLYSSRKHCHILHHNEQTASIRPQIQCERSWMDHFNGLLRKWNAIDKVFFFLQLLNASIYKAMPCLITCCWQTQHTIIIIIIIILCLQLSI